MKHDHLAVAFVIAGVLIVAGVALWSIPLGLIVAGVLVAVLAWLLSDEDGPVADAAPGDVS